jgi:hypothetical protein
VQKQRESQLLVHFKWEDESVIGGYSLKIFEYLGARRPILVTGGYGGDVLEELLRRTNTGVCAFTPEQIKNQLMIWYKEYKEKGNVDYTGKETEIMKYSHREMAKRFSEILELITGIEK